MVILPGIQRATVGELALIIREGDMLGVGEEGRQRVGEGGKLGVGEG